MIYLAGPFFTSGEQAVLSEIERLCKTYALKYYSPRDHNPPGKEWMKDPKERSKVNRSNLDAIKEANFVLAWLDRVLPEGDEILLVHRPVVRAYPEEGKPNDVITDGVVKRRRLMKPDDGTLWEMGYATALGVPVVALTFDTDKPMNLMLDQNIEGLIRGKGRLARFLSRLFTYGVSEALAVTTGEHHRKLEEEKHDV